MTLSRPPAGDQALRAWPPAKAARRARFLWGRLQQLQERRQAPSLGHGQLVELATASPNPCPNPKGD